MSYSVNSQATVPLIQVGQLSVAGEMCTLYWLTAWESCPGTVWLAGWPLVREKSGKFDFSSRSGNFANWSGKF